MSTQNKQGFMPYRLESDNQGPYYGATGGLSYGTSPSYNNIPQHAQRKINISNHVLAFISGPLRIIWAVYEEKDDWSTRLSPIK